MTPRKNFRQLVEDKRFLREFNIRLTQHDPGWSGVDRTNSAGVHCDEPTWQWLRPLLEELIVLRKHIDQACCCPDSDGGTRLNTLRELE